MHWKLKAAIQNAISGLNSSASYETYYWVQRHFGKLRRLNPTSRLKAGISICKKIKEQGHDPAEKVFLEVGTGRALNVPLAYWLMGAKKTVTIDLNPYLKEELIRESLQYIANNREEIEQIFGTLLVEERLQDLLKFFKNNSFSIRSFLDLCRIEYIAPGDAANTNLPPGSIDFHTSYTVFEHIPFDVLKNIINEGNRVIKGNGLFLHKIDYRDHFAQSDKSISLINFLQYSDDEWAKYAGNRYMYMNRLRHDDYLSLFHAAGHRILETEPVTDSRSQEVLRSADFSLDQRFTGKSEEVLSTVGSWIVSQKKES